MTAIWQSLKKVSFLSFFLLLAGCERRDPNNLEPSDIRSHKLNPNPKILLRLNVISSEDFQYKILAGYLAEPINGCSYSAGLGVWFPYGESINVIPQGVEGTLNKKYDIYVDKYMPGPCRWHMTGVNLSIEDRDNRSVEGTLLHLATFQEINNNSKNIFYDPNGETISWSCETIDKTKSYIGSILCSMIGGKKPFAFVRSGVHVLNVKIMHEPR